MLDPAGKDHVPPGLYAVQARHDAPGVCVDVKNDAVIAFFYLKGIIGVVTEWVRGGCSESKEEIISVIQKCIIKP